MSQFNKYARKMDEIAREAFKEYRAAVEREQRAEDARRQYPQRGGAVSAEYEVNSARAQADYLDAVQAREAVRRKMEEGEYRQRINALRKELAADVGEAFRADPAQIDSATLELLKSGICTPDEYGAMLKKAAEAGNVTMCRLIGKYAETAAAAAVEAAGGIYDDPTAIALRAVGFQSQGYNGKQWLEAFDYMADCYNRACRNPGMIDAWAELTADCIERF